MNYTRIASRFRSPRACGSSRMMYYSRKYNLCFKVEMEQPRYAGQTEVEERVYNNLPEKFRSLIPVVDFFSYKGKRWVVMRPITVADDLGIDAMLDTVTDLDWWYSGVIRSDLEQRINKHIKNLELVAEFVETYHPHDMHCCNWGVDEEGNIQIIDWGID